MRKNRLFYLILVVLVCMFACSGPASANVKRIGVVSFENASQVRDREFSGAMTELLVHELLQNKNFEVIDRTRIDKVASEQGFANRWGDAATAAKMGKILGLNYIVIGKIVEADIVDKRIGLGVLSLKEKQAKVLVNIQMIDVESAKVILSEMAEGKVKATSVTDGNTDVHADLPYSAFSGAARKAIAAGVRKIDEILPLEGIVVHIGPQGLIIDIGREHGVRKGQKFLVIREGKPIYHPTTGALITVEKTEIASFTITGVEPNTATSTKISGDKAAIKIGDVVRKES